MPTTSLESSHKPNHFNFNAINITNEKKRIAANESKDFPTESFIQYVNAPLDDSPEVRDLLVDIIKACAEGECEKKHHLKEDMESTIQFVSLVML